MIHGCVTLDEVFMAAGARAASLVPETSGYLALAVGDATSRLPFSIDERLVMLTTEGNVGITKRGEILPPKQAAQGLRTILARLLAVATGTAMPGLSAAARPRAESDRGVDAVVEEIEAALIPVNRSAARRALARLARETIKARESGRLKRPSARPPAQPGKAAAAAPPPKAAAAAPPPPPPALLAEPIFIASPKPFIVAPAPAAAPPAPVVAAPPPAPVVVAAHPAPVVVAAPPPVVVAAPPPAPVVAAPPAPVVAPPPPQPVIAPLPPPPAMVAVPPEPFLLASPLPPRVAASLRPIIAVAPPAFVVAARLPELEAEPPAMLAVTDHDEPFEDAPRDPTPTVLGMAAVEIHEPGPYPTLDAITDAPPAAAALPDAVVAVAVIAVAAPEPEPEAVDVELDPEPTALPESTVLAQPTEDPALAFHLVHRPPDAITPPFLFEVAARGLPAAQVKQAAPPAPAPRAPAGKASAACAAPTRADDLLACFGASCVDEDGMREAAACLRRIAGVDATPPPVRVELRLPPTPLPPAPRAPIPTDWETPDAPRARPRRSFAGLGLGLTMAVLVMTVAGGGAVLRYRPDLLATLAHTAAPARPKAPVALDKEAPPPAPPAAEPAAPAPPPPAFGERIGGARAERGLGQRAR